MENKNSIYVSMMNIEHSIARGLIGDKGTMQLELDHVDQVLMTGRLEGRISIKVSKVGLDYQVYLVNEGHSASFGLSEQIHKILLDTYDQLADWNEPTTELGQTFAVNPEDLNVDIQRGHRLYRCKVVSIQYTLVYIVDTPRTNE
jgi:hypothetical protein